MLNMEQLYEFCMVVRFKNITRAAEYLFISQPSLSRHLSELEVSLGTKLIDRGNTKIFSLTSAGELLFQEGEQLIRSAEMLEQHVKRMSDGTVGNLRVCNRVHDDPKWVRLLYQFNKQYSDVELRYFEVPEEPFINGIFSNHTDIAVAYDYEFCQHLDKIESFKLGSDEFVAMVSKQSPLAERDSITIRELQQYPILTVRDPEIGIFDQGSLAEVMHLFDRRKSHTLNLSTMILQTMIGKGFSIVPHALISSYAGCKALKISDLNIPISYHLIWAKECDNPCVSLFVDYIERNYSNITEET